jgi:hypothetical protein
VRSTNKIRRGAWTDGERPVDRFGAGTWAHGPYGAGGGKATVQVMRAVLSGWLAAAAVAAVAILAIKGLAPEESRPFDEYAQVLRVHLPWLLFSVFMAFVAAYYVRYRLRGWGRLSAALPVPVLATIVSTEVDMQAAHSLLAIVLQLIEALLGVALGLFLVSLFGDDSTAGRVPGSSKGVWEDSR